MKKVLESVTRRRPVLYLGVPGVLMLVVGLIWGLMVVGRVLQAHATPVGNALISVSLCIGGTMAIYASLILNAVRRLELEPKGGVDWTDGSQPAPQISSALGSARTLLLFGLAGLAALLAGLMMGAWALYPQLAGRGLLYGSYIVSVSLCIAGLMTLLCGAILHALHEVILKVQTGSDVEKQTSLQARLDQPVVTHL
jgi:hypothetical protein